MRVTEFMSWFSTVLLVVAGVMDNTVVAAAMFVSLNVWAAADIILKKLERP